MRLIALLVLGFPAAAAAQAPGFVTPRAAEIAKACQKATQCGCGEADCVAQYTQWPGAPTSVFACFTELDCAATCAPNAGAPGSKAHTACLSFEAVRAKAAAYKAKAIDLACAHATKCGCAMPNCKAEYTKIGQSIDGEMFACSATLACEALCAPNAGQAGSFAYDTCIAPAMAKVQQGINAASNMQRKHHQMMMGIIGNMGAVKRRVDIYDADGQYQRTEEQ